MSAVLNQSQTKSPNIVGKAKAMAAMGLVGKDEDGYNVTAPGFRKETFRVWKSEEGRVCCSCAEFTERIDQEPPFRCEHILAVKFYLESVDEKPRSEGKPDNQISFPEEPIAKTMAELVTPRQLVAIKAIANSQKIDAEAQCKELMDCKPEELSRRAASAFIDYLKLPIGEVTAVVEAVNSLIPTGPWTVLLKFTEAVNAKHEGNEEKAERLLYEANQLWKNWIVK